MIWGNYIFPDGSSAPVPFTVGQPKPETVPADIAAAIDMLLDAEQHQAGEEVRCDPKAYAEADAASRCRRAALNAVILKHLRGEA